MTETQVEQEQDVTQQESPPQAAHETLSENQDQEQVQDQDQPNGVQADSPPPAKSEKPARTADISRILQIEVPIIVRLAQKTLPLQDVLDLSPGTVIEFSKSVDDDLDLMINNKCVGSGVAVKIGENFGLRISRIGPIDETIKAMGAAAKS